MVQGFNSDPATLTAALDQAATWQKQSHLTDDVGQDSYADSMPKLGIGNAASGTSDVFQNFVAHEQAWRVDQRVGYTLDALNALATYLSALPGRKNLIWFSGSFPFGLGADSAIPQGASSGFQTENLDHLRDYSAQIRSTGDLLKLARVAVYPMDPSALPTPSMFSSTQTNAGIVRGGAGLNQDNVDSTNELSAHSTMDTIAEETGGRAFYSTNDLAAAISTVTQLGSNYYTLAYVPKEKNYDGKYRKLSIKVDAAKVKLDYRRGYYAEDPDKSPIGTLAHPTRTSAVLLHGAPAATDILFKVRVAPTEVTTQANHPGVVRYSVNWSVDLRGIKLPESGNGMRRGELALALVAYNNDSKAINSVSTPVSLILQADEYQKYLKSGLQFHQEIDLPTGKVYLRIAIVDTGNDRAGATEIPLVVREAPAQAAASQQPAPH
jgi:VWFA-related protein